MRKSGNLSNIVFLTFAIILLYTFELSAAPEQPQKPAGTKAQAIQERRLLFEQQAATAFPEVEAEYARILTYVNSGQTPADPNRQESLKLIARNRKFLPVFNKQPRNDIYYTLSAWVFYFDDKSDKAMKQVVTGHKIAPQSSNLTKTYLALSLIYKDYMSIAEILASQETPPAIAEPQALQDSSSQSSEIELNLDTSSIRPELLGKVFGIRPQIPDQNSSRPDKQLLCVLLWKIDSNELDSFSPAEVKTVETSVANTPPAESNSVSTPSENIAPPSATGEEQLSQTTPFVTDEQQSNTQKKNYSLEAFSQLQSKFSKDTKAVFMGINFNDPSKIKNFENWLAKNPQPWQVAGPSAELQQKVTSFLTASPDKPTLLIIGPDFTTRYVGDVNCFLPQMIVRNILSNSREFAEPNDPNLPPKVSQTTVVVAPTMHAEPNKHQEAPVIKDVNENLKRPQSQTVPPPPVAPASVADNNQQNTEFTADDYQAEKLLSYARSFLKIGNRLPSHIYRNPIELCRQVIKDYPNTKYAQEAQMLLRNVPKEYRKMYNLTDEELGL
jgi:hypothetical protein